LYETPRASWLTIVALLLGTEWLHAQEEESPSASEPPVSIVGPAATNHLAYTQQPTNTTGGRIISPAVTVQLKDKVGKDIALAGVSITISKYSGTEP